MHAEQIVFPRPYEVELQSFAFDLGHVKPADVVIRTHYSLISPGTELACLSGQESWAKLPFVPGYAGCGEVLAVGSEVKDVRVGDLVFSYTKHASVVRGSTLVTPLPPGVEERKACFARMAAVSITALRVSAAELGDHVAVLGLGLVGNLCAQLFMLAGCQVVGIDPSPARRAMALRCGIAHALDPSSEDSKAAVAELTKGGMCETVVEATGIPVVGSKAAELAGKLGEVIFLGSPRGEYTANVTALLNQVHLWGSGCVTFKGAHEWRFPTRRDGQGHHKHSIERNVQTLLALIAQGKLHVDELTTHVLPPSEGATAYRGLREHKDEYMGVLLDWRA
jgi:2-desacetyl-2-hydroxyethyl bacteriochlorophyllide A dehydrogenase